MVEIVAFLILNNLVTAAFIIGLGCIFLAIIGKFSEKVVLSRNQRIIFTAIGLVLLFFSVFSHFQAENLFAQNGKTNGSIAEEIRDLVVIAQPDTDETDAINVGSGISLVANQNDLRCRSGEFAPEDSFSLAINEITLNEGEFIHGQCTEFKLGSFSLKGGVAYVIVGQGTFTWSTMHGWWDICSGGDMNDPIIKLDQQAKSLEDHNNTTTGVARKVFCSYSEGQIVCEQK